MTQITINGNTYSDDGSSPKDMQAYGYLTHLLPMIGDVAIVGGEVAANAEQAALDAITASDGANALRGTSTTSLTVGAGNQTLTTQAGKQFAAGNYVTISRTSSPTTLMHGVVTSYSGSTLVVSVTTFSGSGTFTDWTIALSGAKGNDGATGNGLMAYLSKLGAYTVTASDKGKIIDCTGTFTLSFQACASLGADWTTDIRNSGTGVITLDPNASETIDGAATITLSPGTVSLIQCDGTNLRTVLKTPAKLVRLPIFSAEASALNAVSTLEAIENVQANMLQVNAAICANAGMFVASSSSMGALSNVSSSPDGRTWTLRDMPSSQSWVAASDGSGFLAIADSASAVAYSAAGTSWASATALPGTPQYSSKALAAVSGRYIVRGSATTTTIYSTINNGTSWTTETAPAASLDNIWSVNGLFFAQASASNAYYTSPTGLTGSWTARSLPTTCDSVSQDADGSLVASKNSDVTVNFQRSTDGINWTDLGFGPVVTGGIGLLTIAGVSAHGSTTALKFFTRHNGKWVVRSNTYASSSGASKRVAKIGNVIVSTLLATQMATVYDPTATDAATSVFSG